jgi:hypothetical protein
MKAHERVKPAYIGSLMIGSERSTLKSFQVCGPHMISFSCSTFSFLQLFKNRKTVLAFNV